MLGPQSLPPVDHEVARRHPELAVVSLLAHRNEARALDIGRALLGACADLDPEHATSYTDIVFSFLNTAARRVPESEMNLANYEVRSDFLRNLIAEGQAKGGIAALAHAVLTVLQARGLTIDDAQRTAIERCTDAGMLELWLQRAATAATTDGVFTS